MVEAAGVESEAALTTIGVCENLPNVCRIADNFYIQHSQLID